MSPHPKQDAIAGWHRAQLIPARRPQLGSDPRRSPQPLSFSDAGFNCGCGQLSEEIYWPGPSVFMQQREMVFKDRSIFANSGKNGPSRRLLEALPARGGAWWHLLQCRARPGGLGPAELSPMHRGEGCWDTCTDPGGPARLQQQGAAPPQGTQRSWPPPRRARLVPHLFCTGGRLLRGPASCSVHPSAARDPNDRAFAW